LVPRFLVQQALDEGQLVMPVNEPLPVAQGYFFGYPERTEVPAALQSFERWLIKSAQSVTHPARKAPLFRPGM